MASVKERAFQEQRHTPRCSRLAVVCCLTMGISCSHTTQSVTPRIDEPAASTLNSPPHAEATETAHGAKGAESSSTEASDGSGQRDENDATVSPPDAQPTPLSIVASTCESNCSKMDATCANAAKSCRVSCSDYLEGAKTCPVEIAAALRCQNQADDFLLCSNIAAESCAPLFRDMLACRSGKATPQVWGETADTNDSDELPDNWSKHEIEGYGFTIAMPDNAQQSNQGLDFELKGQDRNQISYIVKNVDGGKKKPDDAHILRTAVHYVGSHCESDIHLHGRYETDGVIHVRFDAFCKDTGRYHGMLHFWNGNVVVASTFTGSEPKEPNPYLEPFIFSFEKKH